MKLRFFWTDDSVEFSFKDMEEARTALKEIQAASWSTSKSDHVMFVYEGGTKLGLVAVGTLLRVVTILDEAQMNITVVNGVSAATVSEIVQSKLVEILG